jgi:uncharacterized protein (DUF488 family)
MVHYVDETVDDLGPIGALISVGYGGRRHGDFIRLLVEHRVSLVIDVRLTPTTRVPGFSRSALSRALPMAGIEYYHEPRLGNPPDNRESFRSGDVQEGRARFEAILMGPARSALFELIIRARVRRVAVLCAERGSARCHRHVIVQAARRISPDLKVAVLD